MQSRDLEKPLCGNGFRLIGAVYAVSALCFATCFGSVSSKSAASSTAAVAVFKGPRLKTKDPIDTDSTKLFGRAGWVRLAFMVSKKGSPYAITVVNSSGDPVLDETAIENLRLARFYPGSRNGKPVASGDLMDYLFQGVSQSVRRHFRADFRKLRRAVQSQNETLAQQMLYAMRPEDVTEDGLKALAQYTFDTVWGTQDDQLVALRRALHDDIVVQFMPSRELQSILLTTLELEINSKWYGEAMALWKLVRGSHLKQAERTSLAAAIAQIKHIRDAHLRYSVSSEIRGTSWFVDLTEPQFSIIVAKGLISEVRLRCQGGYVFFPFDPKLQYTVHGRYGTCTLELIGQPGTQFTLNQF